MPQLLHKKLIPNAREWLQVVIVERQHGVIQHAAAVLALGVQSGDINQKLGVHDHPLRYFTSLRCAITVGVTMLERSPP